MEAKNLIGGLLAGAAIGVAIGILLAPRSGEATRKRIVRESRDAVDDLESTLQGGIDSLKSQFNAAVNETVKRSKEVVAHAANGAKELVKN